MFSASACFDIHKSLVLYLCQLVPYRGVKLGGKLEARSTAGTILNAPDGTPKHQSTTVKSFGAKKYSAI
jgi:hypothetical protein